MRICDWSSDVCSSDLQMIERLGALAVFLLMVGGLTGIAFVTPGGFLLDFVFFYPLFMSALWMAGGLYFWFHWERHWPPHDAAPTLPGTPRSEEHTSELQSLMRISYAVFCLKKKQHHTTTNYTT